MEGISIARMKWSDSLRGCYLALHRAHVPTDFVDLDQLKGGELQQYDVLYIPYSYALDDAAIAALKTYVREGGTLWADGLTGWKDATGTIRPTIPGGLTDLFGVEATDLYPVQPDHPYSVTAENEEGGELWRLPLELKGAEVVLSTPDGKPFEVKHAYGKGQVLYFESAVSLAYDMRFNPVVQQWIVAPSLADESHQLGFADGWIARNYVSRHGAAGWAGRSAFQLGRCAKGCGQLSWRLQSCRYNDGRDGACDRAEWSHAGHCQHEGRGRHGSESDKIPIEKNRQRKPIDDEIKLR